MKKSGWIVLAVLVLAIGGIGALWVVQASHVKKSFAAHIEAFNSGPVKISYDALETSGFPTQLAITLVNPRLAGRIDLLLDPNKQQSLPEWDENIALNGSLQISIDALKDRFTATFNGMWKNTSTVNNHAISLASKTPVSSHCTLEMDGVGGWVTIPWSAATHTNPEEASFDRFRLLDCASDGHSITDDSGNLLLVQSGPARFYISHTPRSDQRDLRIFFKSNDSFFTQDGDRFIAKYYQAMSPHAIPPMLSAYGKQQAELDMAYAGPTDIKNALQASTQGLLPSFEMRIARFVLANDAYNSTLTFDVTNKSDSAAQTQSAHLGFKSETTYNPIYNALVHESVRSMIQESLHDLKRQNKLPDSLKDKDTEGVYAIIAPAIPDFHAMGKWTAAVDTSFQGSAGFTTGDFTLSDFELSVAPYGITGKGAGKRAPGALIPAFDVTFACRNCLPFFDALTGYFNKLQLISVAFTPTPMPALDAPTIEGYRKLLQTLAVDDGAGNFSYSITSDGKMGVTINKKRMDEVLTLYHQYVPQQQR